MRYPLFLTLCLAVVPDFPPPPGPPASATPLAAVQDDGAPLPDAAGLERLARTDPVAFLEACVRRYDREVRGYRTTLQKRERLQGKEQPTEVIDAAFLEKPFRVRMDWREGAGRAVSVLYVQGENDGKLLARPAGALAYRLTGILARDPEGPDARAAGRYPITGFGIKIGTQRILASWRAAQKKGQLHVEYLGRQRVAEAGDRMCYVLRRRPYARPEEDGILDLTMHVDVETWLQVGTVLKGEDNRLIGEYFFRDIRLNPDIPPETFTRQALEK
jgi:hypothetical protein